MSPTLPAHPSLVLLRDQAKQLHRAHARGDVASCTTLRHLRRFQDAPDADMLTAAVSLQEVQLAVALAYGFRDWTALRAHVEPIQSKPKTTDYDPIAPRFDEDVVRTQFERDRQLDARLLAEPDRLLAVLDAGCGTGNFILSQVANFTGRVRWRGLDVSTGMLEVARAKLPDVEFSVGRVERMPYPDGAFDHVVTTFSFHHWEDKAQGLDEVKRVSRPDATFRMEGVEYARSRGWWVYRFFPEAFVADGKRFWDAERVAAELTRRGYRPSITFPFRDLASIPLLRLQNVTATRHYVSSLVNLTDAQFRRGVDRIRRALAADPGGTTENEFTLVRIEAQREDAS